MVIDISSKLTVSLLENYFELLNASNLDVDIVLPVSEIEYNIGTKGLFCQLLNAWVRKTSTAVIRIDGDSGLDKEDFVAKFIKDDIISSLVLMTIKQQRRIVDKVNTDLTLMIRKIVLERNKESAPKIVDRKKVFPVQRNSIAEYSFDHAELPENKFNRWFYQDGVDDPLKEWGFRAFYTAAIESLLQNKPDLQRKATSVKFVEELSGIVKELFDNAHFHARDNMLRVSLLPNMRGVFVDIHHGKINYFRSKTKEGDADFRYFLNPGLFMDSNEVKSFIEISVIDSGIGYAQRYTGMVLGEMNSYIERQKVIECLTKHDRTAKKRGLKRVAGYLSEMKGFFILRTGRLGLYRNFIEMPYRSGDYLVDQYYQIDAAMKSYSLWEGDEQTTSNHSPVCGSLITIFLPIE